MKVISVHPRTQDLLACVGSLAHGLAGALFIQKLRYCLNKLCVLEEDGATAFNFGPRRNEYHNPEIQLNVYSILFSD